MTARSCKSEPNPCPYEEEVSENLDHASIALGRGPGTKSPRTTFPDRPSVAAFQGPLWNALRQGARNVAGVRYQLAVTALLLAESRRRVLPFVELVPEGFEDIDCLDGDSTRWLVQVKEFGAGAGTLTASSIADVIVHAAAARFAPSRIVAITDGRLGTQYHLRDARLQRRQHHRGAHAARLQQR